MFLPRKDVFLTGLARSNFDDSAEDIGIDAVVPLRSWLEKEGNSANGTRHFGKCFVTIKRLKTSVGAIHWVPAPAIREATGMAEKVANSGQRIRRGRISPSLPNV